jgi:hypothetical protein
VITHIKHQPEHYQLEIGGTVVADAHLKPYNAYYFMIELKDGPTLGMEHNMSSTEAREILEWMDRTLR